MRNTIIVVIFISLYIQTYYKAYSCDGPPLLTIDLSKKPYLWQKKEKTSEEILSVLQKVAPFLKDDKVFIVTNSNLEHATLLKILKKLKKSYARIKVINNTKVEMHEHDLSNIKPMGIPIYSVEEKKQYPLRITIDVKKGKVIYSLNDVFYHSFNDLSNKIEELYKLKLIKKDKHILCICNPKLPQYYLDKVLYLLLAPDNFSFSVEIGGIHFTYSILEKLPKLLSPSDQKEIMKPLKQNSKNSTLSHEEE